MRLARVLAAALVALALLAAAARAIPLDVPGAVPPARTPPARTPDPTCAQSYANDRPRGGPRIRFGIGPRLAGETGASQGSTPLVPENPRKRDAALLKLRGTRSFTVRLNRLFESDGAAGIARFRAMARHYAALGLSVELQVRYHPKEADDGNLATWLAFVRRVVATFGPIHHVTALQITNEVNLAISKNSSDGSYKNAVPALVDGVIAAKRLARARGYDQLRIGFNYAWGFGSGASFWEAVGKRATPAFRRSLDWVGMDIYPGTYTAAPSTVRNPGDAFLEGVAQVRECYMPKAKLGRSVPLRIEETGFPTGPGRPEAAQTRFLTAFVTAANAYRGTYGITDFRWFGLRDNNSRGPTYESYFGLLRSDYTPKPAFAAYRALVAKDGARR